MTFRKPVDDKNQQVHALPFARGFGVSHAGCHQENNDSNNEKKQQQ